jgi:hypothetical protein
MPCARSAHRRSPPRKVAPARRCRGASPRPAPRAPSRRLPANTAVGRSEWLSSRSAASSPERNEKSPCRPVSDTGRPASAIAAQNPSTARGGVVSRVALDEGDVAVPQRDQLRGHLARGAIVVHLHLRRPARKIARGDADHGHLVPIEQVEQFGPVAQRRREDRAAQPHDAQGGIDLLQPVGAVMLDLLDHQMVAERAAARERAALDIGGIARCGIVEEQADAGTSVSWTARGRRRSGDSRARRPPSAPPRAVLRAHRIRR